MKSLLAYLFIVLGLGLTFNVSAEAEEKNDIIFCDQYHTVQITREISNCEIWGGKSISEKQYVEAFLNAINNSSKYRLLNKYTKNELKNTLISNVKKYNLDKSLLPKNLLNIKTQITKEESSQTQKITKEVKSSNQDWRKKFELIQNKKKSIKSQKVTKKNINEVHFCKKRESFLGMEPVFLSSYYKNKLVGCDNHIQISDNQYINEILSYRMNAASTVWNSSFFKLNIARNIVKEFNELDLNTKYLREVLQSEYGYYKAQLKQKNLIANKDPTVKPKKKESKKITKKKSQSTDIVSQLKELKDLLDSGVLTNEEFEKAKKIVKVAYEEPKQEEFNKILKNIENSPIGDYYVFGHATTGEKFWGSTESINRTTTEGTTTSSSGRTCKIITKSKNKKIPFKGTFSLECPKEKVKGSWTQETATSPGIGQAFTNKGDVMTAFFSSSRLEVKNFAKKFIDSQETQIAKKEPTQEEFKPKKTNQDNEAPIIEIDEAITVDSQAYTLKGKVKDKSQIYLTIDGRQVQVKKGKFELDRFSINSDATEEIKIVAIDKWNNRSEKIVKVTIDLQSSTVAKVYEQLKPNNIKVKTDNNKIAIIIGIEKYENLTNLDAKYANRDAQAFRTYATRALGIKPSNIKMLIDDKATRSQALKAFKLWLPKIAGKGGKDIHIFFAGHGLASDNGEDLYILPQDGESSLLEDTAISRVELISLINKVNPKSVTMFFDTCYSGQTRDERMLVASLRPIRIVADEQDTPDNFTIFTASNYDQTSGSIEEAKHGMFSYYLMKGLEGNADNNKDKKITNGELIAYLKDNVSQEAFTQNRQQDPMLAGDPDKVLLRY